MIRNYLISAYRNILKHRLYSAINIGGLAIGLAACILILLFVRDEIGYDSWLPDAERIHRGEVQFNIPGRGPITFAQMPGPVRDALLKDYSSEIEAAARIYFDGGTLSIGDRQFNEPRFALVDDSFFDIFDLEMVTGSREAALAGNNSLIISEAMARKYFGDQPAIGQTISYDEKIDYQVVAVMKDIPSNSHLWIDFIAFFDTTRYADRPSVAQTWTSTNVYTYVKTRPGVDIADIAARMPEFIERNAVFNIPGLENIGKSDLLELHYVSVPDIHLRSTRAGGMKPPGSITAVYTFSAVAVLILIIACINFMNLATARSLQRAREVSMRKVLGARRGQLVGQFLGEALLTSVIALIAGVAMVELALPAYNGFLGKELTLDILGDPQLGLAMVGLIVIVALVAGSYPAFVLSNFRPARVLKSNQSSGDGKSWLRSTLVVIQFSISIGLIASTAVIWGQTVYAQNVGLGFDQDQRITLHGLASDQAAPNANAIKQEIERLPGVKGVAYASDSIPQRSNNNTLVKPPMNASGQSLVVETFVAGYGLLEIFGVKPLAGRLFSEEFPGDVRITVDENKKNKEEMGIIINQRAVGFLGYASPEEAVGQTVDMFVSRTETGKATIVGVIPNMHMRSARFDITPLIYMTQEYADKTRYSYLAVELAEGSIPATLAAIDKIWADAVPEVPVLREFVDERIAAQYDAERQRGKMFAGFALFAVFVASLGLYGLASFAADRRTREIGLRKIMGASVGDIVRLLLWQFSKPVLIANVIAWPVAGYFMVQWLNGFTHRIDYSVLPAMAAVAGLMALLIAWVTVGTHAARVARANPINALRYE